MSNDRLSHIFAGALTLEQDPRGYRFSIDALLLAAAVRLEPGDRVCDLGCGCGVIAIALAHHWQPQRIVGVELQAAFADLARGNVRRNAMTETVEILTGDARSPHPQLVASSFDVVVCNPPYHPVSDGRLNPDPQRAIARHELHGGIGEFAATAGYLLRVGGAFLTVYLARRVSVVMDALTAAGLKPEWLRFVHPSEGRDATLVLARAKKGGATPLRIRTPLVIEAPGGGYTEEVSRILEGLS